MIDGSITETVKQGTIPEPMRSGNIREYLGGTWRNIRRIKVIAIFGTGVLNFIILFGAFLTYFALLLGDLYGASPFLIGLFIAGISLTAGVGDILLYLK